MLQKALIKVSEIALFVTLTVTAILVIGNGKFLDYTRAGETTDGDPCSSLTETAGDANGDDALSIVDALIILRYLFAGGDAPVPVCEAGTGDCECPFTDEEVETLQALLEYVSVDEDSYDFEDDDPFPKVLFSGCNVQIVNGLGSTNGYDTDPCTTSPASVETNGLGNLIVGYNETRDLDCGSDPDDFDDARNGSHNIVVGTRHAYSGFGGLVSGMANTISGPYANVNGGYLNLASGQGASVCGGCTNTASGPVYAHVCGGRENVASGSFAVVVGGGNDTAAEGNTATAAYSVVVGGTGNSASSIDATVLGGTDNEASGVASTVGGGSENEETDENGWTATDG